MKRLLLIAILAASTSACVEGNNPVQLLDAVPLDPKTCDRANVSITRGRLNFNVNTSYIMTFTLFSPLEAQEGTGGNDFYGEEIVLNYESLNPKVDFKEEIRPVYFLVEAGADDGFISMDLIGTEARKRLEGVVPSSPDAMTLLVYMKIKGKLASGNAAETNEVRYPIEITRAGSCPAGQEPATTAENPCGFPGQDGNPITCRQVQSG
jgi:hypothetical protein